MARRLRSILIPTIATAALGFYVLWATNIWPEASYESGAGPHRPRTAEGKKGGRSGKAPQDRHPAFDWRQRANDVEARHMLLVGFVLTAWAIRTTIAKSRHDRNSEETDTGLLGDDAAQEEDILVFGIGVDDAKEEPAVAKELDAVPFEDTTMRRSKAKPNGCFNMGGLFTNSGKTSRKTSFK